MGSKNVSGQLARQARELLEITFFSAYLKTPMPSPQLIEQVAAELARENGITEAGGGDGLVEVVVGCRHLRDALRDIELEAARQARERGVTVRELAAATGIAERRANDRYRRERH